MDRGLTAAPAVNAEGQADGRRSLLVVAQLPPPVHGAAVVNQQVVSSPLLRTKFRMMVVPIDATTELSEIRKFSVAKVWRSMKTALRISHSLLKERPDVAYLTMSPKGFAFWRDSVFLLLFRLTRTRHTVHLHGRGMQSAHAGKWSEVIARYVLGKATVIHLSPRLKQETDGIVADAQLRFIANGVPDPLHGTGLSERGKTGQAPVILFLGTMLENKGPMVLLAALEILNQRKVPFSAVFAGPWRGSLSKQVFEEKLSSAGLVGKVSHIGAVYGEAKEQLLKSADIMAFPTHYENEAFPLVVLEGMAAGLIPVTSDIAALPDIVEGAGICVPPQDPKALADALEELLADAGKRRGLHQRARQKYLSSFTLPRFEENLSSVLEQTAGAEKMRAGDRRA